MAMNVLFIVLLAYFLELIGSIPAAFNEALQGVNKVLNGGTYHAPFVWC